VHPGADFATALVQVFGGHEAQPVLNGQVKQELSAGDQTGGLKAHPVAISQHFAEGVFAMSGVANYE
jgi:hypothetical protein